MGKVLGIDYGEKYIGIALSDESQTLAFPKTTIENNGIDRVLDTIEEIMERENVEEIVVGSPLYMTGEESEMNTKILEFTQKLEERSDLETVLLDERLTTEQVARERKHMGLHGKKFREEKDALAAGIILNTYLEKKLKKNVDKND